MAAKVHLMPNALHKIDAALHAQVRDELQQVFPQASEVTAYDVVEGYTQDQQRKLIVAVETRTSQTRRRSGTTASCTEYQAHIVKLGLDKEVAGDLRGWQTAVQGRPVSGRMFVAVSLHPLAHTHPARAAVVYQDATQWYGLLAPNEQVATLETAVHENVFRHTLTRESVERVFTQVYRELGRWFYRSASLQDPADFYRGKLKLPDEARRAVHRWRNEDLWTLRRDAVWLLCGHRASDSQDPPEYVDPYDYMLWALETNAVPESLVGLAHGDLHGRNVLVGVCDDVVEYPLLIDYADISPRTVIAWDFAKMETELKVRLLEKLFCDPAARQWLWARAEHPVLQALVASWKDVSGLDELQERTQLILLAAEFEKTLARSTGRFFQTTQRGPVVPATGCEPLDKALGLLLRIRYEAAVQLGEQRRRLTEWQDEFYFALAAYGLSTAKYDDHSYRVFHRLFALISAGVAVAQLRRGRDVQQALLTAAAPPTGPHPSYLVPLFHAYTRWKKKDELEVAEEVLRGAADMFDYSVPLRRDYALLLAVCRRHEEALSILERIILPAGAAAPPSSHAELLQWCRAFADIEVLSRMGRIYKDKADQEWEVSGVSFEELNKRPQAQFYRTAYGFYYEAFKLSGNYYPGGNAAVTTLLAGEPDQARAVAREVELVCEKTDLSRVSSSERYWILATEGDLALIMGDSPRAADFYRQAFEVLDVGNDGFVQTSYRQLCRLYKALGPAKLGHVTDVFRDAKQFRLNSGPLGDCGGMFPDRKAKRLR
jgi:hypothetical protein